MTENGRYLGDIVHGFSSIWYGIRVKKIIGKEMNVGDIDNFFMKIIMINGSENMFKIFSFRDGQRLIQQTM